MANIKKQLTSLTDSNICEVLDILQKTYPNAECALSHNSVYQLLTAVSLSAQTTDKSVNLVTPALFEKYPDAESLAMAAGYHTKDPAMAKAMYEETLSEVTELIRRIGMYRTKAKNAVNLAIKLMEDFDGIVPQDIELLQTLPGVGRKTANVVLAVGFGENRMPVDTHVLRVSHRIGLVKDSAASRSDALKTEQVLLKVIPSSRLTEAHHSLIFHGRNCCDARKPDCPDCPIAHICKKIL